MGNPVVHFEIMGKSAKTLATFYRDAFGWEIGEPAGPQEYSLVNADPGHERGIRGGIGTSPDGYNGGATFYIGVTDINEALRTVEKLGGNKMMEPREAPGGIIISYFRDPEGHAIGLVQIPE
jgi:predicted enzyme related to lactoylglutathione lyase